MGERRTPNPLVAGSTPVAPALERNRMDKEKQIQIVKDNIEKLPKCHFEDPAFESVIRTLERNLDVMESPAKENAISLIASWKNYMTAYNELDLMLFRFTHNIR